MNLKFQKAEQAYCPNVEPEFDNDDIEDFLIENFKIPDNNLNQISSLINEYGELKKIILDLPEMIKKEFPNDEMQIRFYDEFQEYELILEIGIFSSFDEESSFEKEKRLDRLLYDKYDCDAADKIIILME